MKNVVIVSLLLVSAIGFSQKNLIKNGNLDLNTENWRGDVLTNNPYEKKTGAACGMINQFTGFDWKGVDQIFDIPKGTFAIEFSAWVKCEGIEGGKNKWNAGIMTAAFTTGIDTEISTENIAEVHGSQSWNMYKKIVMIPGGAKKTRLMLALAQTPGTIYYDDVKAVVVSEDDYLKLMQEEAQQKKDIAMAQAKAPQGFINGNFEDGLTAWNGSATVSKDNPKEGTSCAAVISTSSSWTAISQAADIPSDVKNIEFSGWLKGQDILQGKDSWNHGMLIVEFTKDGTTKVATDTNLVDVVGTTDWAAFKKTLAVPEGAKKYRIMLALNNAVGALLADGIQVNLLRQ